uniref:Uncharacterized protein n=1 Tax=Setaria italica TaxID=4555 RepID=K3YMN8_SETIT
MTPQSGRGTIDDEEYELKLKPMVAGV